MEIDHCNQREFVSLFTFHNYDIGGFIFNFHIFLLIPKLSDRPPEWMDIHVLYDTRSL